MGGSLLSSLSESVCSCEWLCDVDAYAVRSELGSCPFCGREVEIGSGRIDLA